MRPPGARAGRASRRPSFSQRNPVPIAIIGLTAMSLALLLALNFQRVPFLSGGTTYRAAFTDASGLAAGEEVRVAGIKVGQVRDISLDGNQVVVEFTVDGPELGDETQAGIELKSLLGQHYLSVTPAGDGTMAEGALIPLARTATPINVVPAFNRLSEQSAKIDTAQVAEAFDALAETLDATAPEMTPALRGLSRISRSVSGRDEQIKTLFERANDVSGVVADRDQELGQLLTASDQVLDVLASRRATIRALIRGTSRLAGQLGGLVRDNRRTLKPALDKLDTVLDVLNANADDIDSTLTYAAPYAREFTNVGGTGRWFDATLKFPRGVAVCSTNDSTAPGVDVLDSVLSQINQATNGSSTPCLPLGPAVGSRLSQGAN